MRTAIREPAPLLAAGNLISTYRQLDAKNEKGATEAK
jgi:hypothetical protein